MDYCQKMKVYKSTVNKLYYLRCPACGVSHAFGDGHGFDGNYQSPTIQGSLGWTGMADDGLMRYCHSTVANGRITFVSDSQHILNGQTVELPEIYESPNLL